MLFIQALKVRTPQYREALRETDERAAEIELEIGLRDRERYHATKANGRDAAEVEAERVELLADLKAGRLVVASSPEREVALMAMGLREEVTATLLASLGWKCARIPVDSKASFVLSDNPVSHYDPSPVTPEAGAGFISSADSVTWVPLDARFGLLLSQEHPGMWQTGELDDDDIDEVNLMTYASARDAVYGPTQEAVTRVRRLAKQNRRLVAEFRYRPPRLWVTEGAGEEGDAHVFTSRYRGQVARRMLHIAEASTPKTGRRGREPSVPREPGARPEPSSQP